MWREGLGAYKIITEDKKGYRNHPAVKEFENYPGRLQERLRMVRQEMLLRNYHPKELPVSKCFGFEIVYTPLEVQWQTLEEQVEVLKNKKCKCKI
jgi:lantibiotic modifying enzyme